MLNIFERNKQILDFIVRDYVKTAHPVSSSRVLRKLKLDLSSATIRNIMSDLEERGFLEKEHTSSGRAPTDLAYRYFVDCCMSEAAHIDFFSDFFQETLKQKSNEDMADFITAQLANALDVFIAVGSLSSRQFFSGGSEHLLKKQEFERRDLVRDFGFVLDHLEDVIKIYTGEKSRENTDKRILVSIGKENRLKETKLFSIFAGNFKNIEGRECVLFSLGPRRLDYEKNYSLISYAVNEMLPNIL